MTQYRTLEDVARKIGADDGRRKAFIWISGGNRGAVTDPIDGGSVNDWFYLNALGGLLESLRRSSVATYAIATGDFGSDVLRKVADESSGFVMRAEDFDRDLELLVSDLDHYYLLGFYPDDLSDKGYHQLDVRVTQPGVTVRHRRGYRPGGAPAPPKNKTALSRMAAGVLPATDLPLRLHAAALAPTANTAARLAITMEVRADVAPLLDSDGTMRDVLRYEVWAVDLKKKKPTRSVAREVRVALRDVSETPPASEKVTYHVQTSLVVTPGKYQLRAAATSAKLGRGGSVYLQTEMPDFRAGDLQLSLVLGSNSGDPAPIAGNVLPKTWLPLEPSLDREFRKTDVLRLFCDVVKPARTAADVLVELIDGANQGVTRIDERHFVPLQQARLDLAVPIHGLEPGGYIVRVTATNGASRAQREVGFVVK